VSTYSSRLYLGPLPTTQGVLYTCPTGVVTVVKDVELYQWSGGALFLYIAVKSGPAVGTFAGSQVPSSTSSYQWQGRVVLNAGDELLGLSPTANNQCIISGYQLSGP
jgi:hypothetical protein